jgi:carbon monoxide dehydrogenase subunit G
VDGARKPSRQSLIEYHNNHSKLTVNFHHNCITLAVRPNHVAAEPICDVRVERSANGYATGMPSVARTFSVTTPPDRVVDYLKDFGNAEEWDPGTESCTRSDTGPIREGSTWHNVSKIVGVKAELTYTLNTLSNRTLVFVGENDSSTSVDTITVDASGAGSVITYQADLEMKGAAKLLSPAMKLVFEKLANDTEKQMTSVLNKI